MVTHKDLTTAEHLIIRTMALKLGKTRLEVRQVYIFFLNGAELDTSEPEWMQDLWREAQERKHYH